MYCNLFPTHDRFDDMFTTLVTQTFNDKEFVSKFPATDIYKDEDDVTHIDVAVTGFSEDDIKISLNDDVLKIEAKIVDERDDSGIDYITKNIAKRAFKKEYKVNDIQDVEAEIKNGILCLTLIPDESKKTKKLIQIKKSK